MPMSEDQQSHVCAPPKSEDEAAYFTQLPNCRALVIPIWMVEKIHVDFTSPTGDLVVQFKKGEECEEDNEGS